MCSNFLPVPGHLQPKKTKQQTRCTSLQTENRVKMKGTLKEHAIVWKVQSIVSRDFAQCNSTCKQYKKMCNYSNTCMYFCMNEYTVMIYM